MSTLCFTAILCMCLNIGASLYGATMQKTPPFSCPHCCGEWGSKSLQRIEWGFVELLYQADKMSAFLSECSAPYEPFTLKSQQFFSFFKSPQDYGYNWDEANEGGA
jgi:hypothetical protein